MHNTMIRLALSFALALLLVACAASPGQQTNAPEAVKTYQFEPWDGDGMEIPLDGSSLEAFETSLARVKAHTSRASYATLENAIEYLLVYDLAANRDRAQLAARLDGLTPYQVVQKVGWKRPVPHAGKAGQGTVGTANPI